MDSAPQRILLVRLTAAGDILLCLPVLHALRAAYPQAHLSWLVDERFAELLRHQPDLDEVLAAPMRRWRRMLQSPLHWLQLRREARAFVGQMRSGGPYDLCLELHGIAKAAFVARGARSRRTLESTLGRMRRLRPFLRREWIAPLGPHLRDRFLALAAAVGADISQPSFAFHVTEEARGYADGMLAGHDFGASEDGLARPSGPLVAINPGASTLVKRWPAERLAQVARRLNQEVGARIVVLGGPGEVDLARSLADQADVGALCTAGRTDWEQLAAILQRCDVVVTSDSGPMHLAAAVGTPVVAIFGSTSSERTGPSGPGHVVIERSFPCRPCMDHPTCDDRHCLMDIGVDEVETAVRGLLGGPESG